MPLLALLQGGLGAVLVTLILWDAFETVLVPRRIGRRFRLTPMFYIVSWQLWRGLARRIPNPTRREGMLALFGPLSLLLLLVCWASGLILGFALMLAGVHTADHALSDSFMTVLYMSGETFFTLGFGDITPTTAMGRVLAVFEAGMGFGFLGTVVGYLPTLYSAFSQREVEISMLDQRAGSPPTAAEFLRRNSLATDPWALEQVLREWEKWAAQLLETQISYPLLAYYRSQHSNQSWLSALTTILDSSALLLVGPDASHKRQARLSFAMARHALVDITQNFLPEYRPHPADRLPRAELERLLKHLEGTSLPMPLTSEFEERLTFLRRTYEPYAEALAAYLLYELPPWMHARPRRDNWRSGPWDRQLGVQSHPGELVDEHF